MNKESFNQRPNRLENKNFRIGSLHKKEGSNKKLQLPHIITFLSFHLKRDSFLSEVTKRARMRERERERKKSYRVEEIAPSAGLDNLEPAHLLRLAFSILSCLAHKT